jgi:hypothetical protein
MGGTCSTYEEDKKLVQNFSRMTYWPHLQGLQSQAEAEDPEDGESMCLRNVDIYIRVYTASQPRRTKSPSSQPWAPEISFYVTCFRLRGSIILLLFCSVVIETVCFINAFPCLQKCWFVPRKKADQCPCFPTLYSVQLRSPVGWYQNLTSSFSYLYELTCWILLSVSWSCTCILTHELNYQ